jgi:hypothetical protein
LPAAQRLVGQTWPERPLHRCYGHLRCVRRSRLRHDRRQPEPDQAERADGAGSSRRNCHHGLSRLPGESGEHTTASLIAPAKVSPPGAPPPWNSISPCPRGRTDNGGGPFIDQHGPYVDRSTTLTGSFHSVNVYCTPLVPDRQPDRGAGRLVQGACECRLRKVHQRCVRLPGRRARSSNRVRADHRGRDDLLKRAVSISRRNVDRPGSELACGAVGAHWADPGVAHNNDHRLA